MEKTLTGFELRQEIRRMQAVAQRHGGYAVACTHEGRVTDARMWAKTAAHKAFYLRKLEAAKG
jgi:hypothetical protein